MTNNLTVSTYPKCYNLNTKKPKQKENNNQKQPNKRIKNRKKALWVKKLKTPIMAFRRFLTFLGFGLNLKAIGLKAKNLDW